jgi:hypothetical protein
LRRVAGRGRFVQYRTICPASLTWSMAQRTGKSWCRVPRRRTGVKIAGGTAGDAVLFWPGEAVGKSGAGIWSLEGPFIVAASTRVRFLR